MTPYPGRVRGLKRVRPPPDERDMDGQQAGEPAPARSWRPRPNRRWWGFAAFLLLPALLLTPSDAAFRDSVNVAFSGATDDLNRYLPDTLTTARTANTICKVTGTGKLQYPTGTTYAVMDSSGKDLLPGATTATVDVTVPTATTPIQVQVRNKNWVSGSVKKATCPAALAAPTNVYATGGDAKAAISWTNPATNGTSNTKSYTATASPGGASCTTADSTGNSCVISGLTNDTTYSVTVAASSVSSTLYTGPSSNPAVSVTPTQGVGLAAVGEDAGAGMALATTSSTVPRQVGVQAVWSNLSVADHGVCGLRSDGGVPWCWGAWATPAGDRSDNPLMVENAAYTQISGTSQTHCGIRTGGTLWCWGDNPSGQVGTGSTGGVVSAPTQISGTWTSVAAGVNHTCGIRSGGTLWCWGNNTNGQLGSTAGAAKPSPTQVGSDTWLSVTAGRSVSGKKLGSSTCGIKTDNTLWCWGHNGMGQLGAGATGADVPAPTQVGSSSWSQVQTAGATVCAISGTSATGPLYCWGDNTYGQVGNGTSGNSVSTPTKVTGGATNWSRPGTGFTHTCAVRSDGSLWCWGRNNTGQLGNGQTRDNQSVPVSVGTGYTAVAAGDEFSCGVKTDQTFWCWGTNANGQMGSATQYTTPYTAAGSWTRGAIGGTSPHTCYIDSNQALWCGGDSTTGSAGNGSNGSVAPPVKITAGTSTWLSVASGELTTCAVDTDTKLWCWGGYTSSRPQRVGTDTGWLRVSTFEDHTCAVKTDGTLWCWGKNGYGQLGINNTSQADSPVQVGTRSDWRSVAVGYHHTCAVTTGNQLWCWGLNASGQLGNNSIEATISPIQVTVTGVSWNAVSAGGYDDSSSHTCAITTDQKLYCWGANALGQVGTGSSSTTVKEPAPVGSALYRDVSAGGGHTCAVDTSNHVFCWGSNDSGQLGNGSVGGKATAPAQIPGVTAARVVAGPASTLLMRATQLPPATVTGVTVTAGTGKVTVSWSDVTTTGGSPISNYTASAVTADGATTMTPCTSTGTSCDITGLTSGSTYSVWVTATNGNGTSGNSVRVSVKIP